MRYRSLIDFALLALTGVVVTGCAARSAAKPESENTAGASDVRGTGTMADMCPMQVPGTKVTYGDVEGGAALSFSTKNGDVAELRRRVGRMAEMHNEMSDHGSMMMPAATASVEDIPGGARIVLRPRDPAQLDALREQVRAHARRMASGECPMMTQQSGPGGGGPGAHHPPK